MDFSSKCVLIADNGLFVAMAERLARDWGEVLYFSPWASAYPKAAGDHVGYGLPGVKRVPTFWDHVEDADLIVFPDLYFADWQAVVREQFGKPCWGHACAEYLELDRQGTRKLQKELGIASPRTRFFTGVDALQQYLDTVEDKWVKISCYRGDAESWRHTTPHATSTYLDHFRNRVGALAGCYEFMVEDHIEGVELGYDGWTVHGAFPEKSFWGIEVKDKGYIGKFSDKKDIPSCINEINQKMSPILREEGAVGFCSFEFRLGSDGVARMIDPCLRAGSPPFECTQEAYANLSDILWEGGHGRMIVPEAAGKYTAMAMIHSQFALTNWVPIDVPKDVRRWVKLRNAAMIDGKLYHVPVGGDMPELGAVVAYADTLERAKELVRSRAEQVKGYNLEIHVDALDSACETIEEANQYGVFF